LKYVAGQGTQDETTGAFNLHTDRYVVYTMQWCILLLDVPRSLILLFQTAVLFTLLKLNLKKRHNCDS